MLAHAGLGLTVLGIVAATTWSGETHPLDEAGRHGDARRLRADARRLRRPRRPELSARPRSVSRCARAARTVATLEPAKRRFAASGTDTTESAIRTFGFSQLYLSIGDIAADGTVTARLYWKPLVTLIWLGAVVMAFGGAAVAQRPAPARRRSAAGQARQPAPAE